MTTDTEIEKQVERVKSTDVIKFAMSQGLIMIEMNHLYGKTLDFPFSDRKLKDEGDSDIKDITFSIMIRLLMKHPEAMPFKKMTTQDFFEMVKPYEPGLKINTMSIYVGLGFWASSTWNRDGIKPGARVFMAFNIIKELIDMYGEKGWKMWKEQLDMEARSRGTTLKKVIEEKRWPSKSKKEEGVS